MSDGDAVDHPASALNPATWAWIVQGAMTKNAPASPRWPPPACAAAHPRLRRVIPSYVMPSRRILQLGDPLLRTVSVPVSTPSAAIPIFADLRATLQEFRRTRGFGRGISAVQIGEPRRLIYIEFEGVAYALGNPVYEFQSEAKFRMWDDCFSFPDLLVYLERSQSVRVR